MITTLSFIIIFGITILVSQLGSYFTTIGMPWYETLMKSALTPPGWVFGLVWTVLYIATMISVIITWNYLERTARFWMIMVLFGLNAMANLGWTYLFFYHRLPRAALYDIVIMIITLFLLILLLLSESKKAALLLLPYFFWTCFAFYLNYQIIHLNN